MRSLILVACIIAVSGCSFDDNAQTAQRGSIVIAKSIETGEPIIASVEEILGPIITEEQKSTAQSVLGNTQAAASWGAAVAGAIPGGQGVAAALGAIGTLAGGLFGMIQRRKTKQTAKAAVLAADKVQGGGAAITNAAIATGAIADIRSALSDVKGGA